MQLNRDRAASILVDAAYWGDKAACERNHVVIRTLQRYRVLLANDSEVSRLVAVKKAEVDAAWADGISSAIVAAIEYLRDAARVLPKNKSENVFAVAGALKILADVRMTKAVLDARLAERVRQVGEEDRAVASRAILTGAYTTKE